MTKTLTIAAVAAAFAALATSASAASVTVSLVGKDMKTIRADIERAARQVCSQDLESRTDWIAGYARCVDDTVAQALKVLPSKAS